MNQKLYPYITFSGMAVLALICCYLLLNRPVQVKDVPTGETMNVKEAYTLEKINQINDKIIERRIVEDTYFYYIGDDAELLEELKQYNEQTGDLTGEFMDDMLDIAVSLYRDMTEAKIEYGRTYSTYMDLPPEIHEFQRIITRAALYRNCADILYADDKVGTFLGAGRGGSLGMWPKSIQNESGSWDEPLRADLKEYFELIDRLLVKLDERRNALVSTQ